MYIVCGRKCPHFFGRARDLTSPRSRKARRTAAAPRSQRSRDGSSRPQQQQQIRIPRPATSRRHHENILICSLRCKLRAWRIREVSSSRRGSAALGAPLPPAPLRRILSMIAGGGQAFDARATAQTTPSSSLSIASISRCGREISTLCSSSPSVCWSAVHAGAPIKSATPRRSLSARAGRASP